MQIILLPFRLLKVVILTAFVIILLMPIFGGTMETYHGMKAANARAQARAAQLHAYVTAPALPAQPYR